MSRLAHCLSMLLAILALASAQGAHAASIFLKARLDGAQAGTPSTGDGAALFAYDTVTRSLSWTVTYRNLSSAVNAAHLHGPAERGASAGIQVPFSLSASPLTGNAAITASQEADMLAGLWYVNVHTDNFPLGEIRGQLSLVDTNFYSIVRDGGNDPPIPGFTESFLAGSARFDPATGVLAWNISWSVPFHTIGIGVGFGFYGPAAGPGERFAPATVLTPNHGAPGSTLLTAVQAAELVNGFWYYFVDASVDERGMIGLRGQVYPAPPRLEALSTRMQVQTGDNVLIGGFIIDGAADKTVVVRARGPSLATAGITNPLADPLLQLVRASDQVLIATNDDWQNAANAIAVANSGFAPTDPRESAVLMTLSPGAYTAIVSGAGGAAGIGLVEVFEVDRPDLPMLAISTRGRVLANDGVMIGGFIIQGNAPQTVVVRARGPSLAAAGIAGVLANPILQLVAADGSVITNDDWQQAPNAADIDARGLAPTDPHESAILVTLSPGAYTAIVSGVGGSTGVAIVEVIAQ